ncbi:MAG: hypothetical protein WD533_06485 [Dehalococcoidia bacterium]
MTIYSGPAELDSAEIIAALGYTPLNAAELIRVVKTADEVVNNSATLQNDDELLLSVGANETWNFTLFIYVDTPATADFQCAFAIPSGASGDRLNQSWNGGFSSSDTIDVTAAQSTALVSGNRVIAINGRIIVGATPGTVQFQWAQDVAGAVDTIVRAGSCLIARKAS